MFLMRHFDNTSRHVITAGLVAALAFGACTMSPASIYAEESVPMEQEGAATNASPSEMTADDQQQGNPQPVSQPTVQSNVANAETTAQNLQAQLNIATETLSKMFDELEDTQASLSKTTYELEQTNASIASLEQQIEQSNLSLQEKQAQLARQVADSYKVGTPSLLEFLMGSKTFEELTSNIFYQNKVAEKLAEDIQATRDLKVGLTTQVVELESLKAEQEQQVQTQQQKSESLKSASERQTAYVNQLNEEVKAALQGARLQRASDSLAAAQKALLDATNDLERAQAAAARDAAQAEYDAASIAEAQAREAAANARVEGGMPGVSSVYVPSAASTDQRTTAVNAALSQLGVAYGFTCETPGVGFDCNGLVHWAWAQAGVDIPYPSGHYMYGQFQWLKASGRWVNSASQLLPGDLVFYSKDGGASTYHVAMYVGGGLIVHAAGYQWGIITSPIDFCTGFCGGGSPL